MLEETGTWELVDAPLGANIIGSKWVFRVKKDVSGRVICYKARLVLTYSFRRTSYHLRRCHIPVRQLR
jgi:hypothetical protein